MNRTERIELPDGEWYERELDLIGRVIGTRNSYGEWSKTAWGDDGFVLSYLDSRGITASNTKSPEGKSNYEFKDGLGGVFVKWVKDPKGRFLSYEDQHGVWDCLAFDGTYNLRYSPKLQLYRAGCREFNRTQALNHWGDKKTDSNRAKLFYEVILNHNPIKEVSK